MERGISLVRRQVQKLSDVSVTWFEWETNEKGDLTRTLVVQVDLDTDPTSAFFKSHVFQEIEDTVKATLKNETTMSVSRLKVIPKQVG